MNKSIRILGTFSLALLLVLGLSFCQEKGGRSFQEFDGTLIVTNNAEFTVEVEIDASIKKSDLAGNSQWSTLLFQGPHTVKIRKADDKTQERVYEVDMIAGATTAIIYP